MSAYFSYQIGKYYNAFNNLRDYLNDEQVEISKENIIKIIKEYNDLQKILINMKEYTQNNNIDMPIIIYNGNDIKIENFKELLGFFCKEEEDLNKLYDRILEFIEDF